MCIKLFIEISLYYDAWSKKRQMIYLMTSNLHNRKFNYTVMLGIFWSGVIFFVKCRTTCLLANPTIVLKDGWTVCEGWIKEAKLKQFVCKQSLQTVFHFGRYTTRFRGQPPHLLPYTLSGCHDSEQSFCTNGSRSGNYIFILFRFRPLSSFPSSVNAISSLLLYRNYIYTYKQFDLMSFVKAYPSSDT